MKRYRRKFDSKKLALLKISECFVLTLIAVILIFSFVIGVSPVSGSSMSPTVEDGRAAVYFRLSKGYRHGDIVSVQMPSGEYLIKRVIAVGGDTVDIREGIVFVNGKKENSSYVNGNTEPDSAAVIYPLTLSDGQYFVMGDNRTVSVDSRNFGPVVISQTRGKILFFL